MSDLKILVLNKLQQAVLRELAPAFKAGGIAVKGGMAMRLPAAIVFLTTWLKRLISPAPPLPSIPAHG